MARSRAADDFDTIRLRMEELRLERDRALVGQKLGSRSTGRLLTRTIARTSAGCHVQLFFGRSSAKRIERRHD